MMTNTNQGRGEGKIGLIIVLVIGLFFLYFIGFDVREVIESKPAIKIMTFAADITNNLWSIFIRPVIVEVIVPAGSWLFTTILRPLYEFITNLL